MLCWGNPVPRSRNGSPIKLAANWARRKPQSLQKRVVNRLAHTAGKDPTWAQKLLTKGKSGLVKFASALYDAHGRRETVRDIRGIAHGTHGAAHDTGRWLLRNREWIGETLREFSMIFGGLAAGLGVASLIAPPLAPFLTPAALTFGAAAAAARAWHSTSLAVGTIDGSVRPDMALHEAKWAAVDTVLAVGTAGVSNARFITKAKTVSEMKAIAPLLNNPASTVVTFNRIIQQANRLLGLNLGMILRNPQLASRLGWVSKALTTAKLVKKVVETGKSGLVRLAQGIASKAGTIWEFAKHAGLDLLHRGEHKMHQAGNFFHDLKGKYYPKPQNDGNFTGPFFPRRHKPWGGPPPPQSYLRSLVGTGQATLFVNGVNTTYEDHLKAAQRIADDTGSTVVGVYNASGVPSDSKGTPPSKIGMGLGLLRDGLQTLSDKVFDKFRNPAVKSVADLIVQYGNVDKGKGGLKIEAHSQGSVIVSEALRQARDRGADIGSKERGKRIHVNTWGNASWTFPQGPEYHHRVHDSDVISTALGSSSRFANFVQTNPLAHRVAERFLGPMANAPADTRVLPHAGTGLEPHFVNQALPAGVSGPKPHDYLDDRSTFEKLEKHKQPFSFRANEKAATRALFPNMPGRKREAVRHGLVGAGRMAMPFAAGLLGGRAVGAAAAMVRGAAVAAPPLARRMSAFGGQTVAPAYNRFDAGVRALPSLPFLPPNMAWGGMDAALRSVGSRVMGFSGWLGGGIAPRGSGPVLQRSGHGDHPDVNPAALRADLRKQSGGFTPDSNVRAKLGGHLGFDPGGARLHTGPAAAQAARSLNAEAFTIGSDVFFGEGRFDPHSPKGLGLIAHELTHVGQQTGTTGSKARFFTERGGDEMEREAQQTGERVLANAGRRGGLFVENYVREYQSEGGLTHSDQQRLDRISLEALNLAEWRLAIGGRRGGVGVDALDVQVEIDLSEMSDSEAARVWAEAIVSAMQAQQAADRAASASAVQMKPEAVQLKGAAKPHAALTHDQEMRVVQEIAKALPGLMLQPVRRLPLPHNMEITGFVTGFRGGGDGMMGVGAGAAADAVMYLDLTSNKWSREAVISPEVGVGLEEGVSASVLFGFRVSPRGNYGKINEAYEGETFSAAIKLLAGVGVGVSPCVLEGQEGFITFSASLGLEGGLAASYSYGSQLGSGKAGFDYKGAVQAATDRVKKIVGFLGSAFQAPANPKDNYNNFGNVQYDPTKVGRVARPGVGRSALPGTPADTGADEQAARTMQFAVASGISAHQSGGYSSSAIGLQIQRSPVLTPDSSTPTSDSQQKSDIETIVGLLDKIYLTEASEAHILGILTKWAAAPNPPSARPRPGSRHLEQIFQTLQSRHKKSGIVVEQTISYYSVMFNRFSNLQGLRHLRDTSAPLFTGYDGEKEVSFSGELWKNVKSGETADEVFCYGKGLVKGVIGGVTGMYMMVRHPIQTAKGTYEMVVHFDQTKKGTKKP